MQDETTFVDEKIENFTNDLVWLGVMTNDRLDLSIVESFRNVFIAAIEDSSATQESLEAVNEYIDIITEKLKDLVVYKKLLQEDKLRLKEIIIFIYNTMNATGDQCRLNEISEITSLLEDTLSLKESISVLQKLVARLEPLLAISGIELESNRGFLEAIDEHYSGLNEKNTSI